MAKMNATTNPKRNSSSMTTPDVMVHASARERRKRREKESSRKDTKVKHAERLKTTTGRIHLRMPTAAKNKEKDIAPLDTTWTGVKNHNHVERKTPARLPPPASECSGLMDMIQQPACKDGVRISGKTKNAAPKEVREDALKATSTSRVREDATMVEMNQSTTLTAPPSAKESNFSDAVCQLSTDSSVSRRET